MTHETLTVERALELLREVVAERPDYIYESPVEDACVYIDPADRRPSCLIGHVLIRAGWEPDELEGANSINAESLLLNYTVPQVEPDVARILQAAQRAQDDGDSWATALLAAEEASRWPS